MMEKDSKIYVAGHKGLVGSALIRTLLHGGYTNIITRNRKELNLLDPKAVLDFFASEKPEYVFLAAAKVGGIMANQTYPGDFIRENLQIELNVMEAAHQYGVTKLLFLGSSCIYPKLAPQPIKEEYLLSGPLEPTNEPYAIAKIAGIILSQSYRKQYGSKFISVMPTNLYGENDNFDLKTSHVLPALIRRFHEARTAEASNVTLWGSGKPRREFLHVDDLADACVYLMNTYDSSQIVNIGTGEDISIGELAEMIASIVGYTGIVDWDITKPDGTPRKLLDISRLQALGFTHKISLREGIKRTYAWYLQNRA